MRVGKRTYQVHILIWRQVFESNLEAITFNFYLPVSTDVVWKGWGLCRWDLWQIITYLRHHSFDEDSTMFALCKPPPSITSRLKPKSSWRHGQRPGKTNWENQSCEWCFPIAWCAADWHKWDVRSEFTKSIYPYRHRHSKRVDHRWGNSTLP